MRKVTLYHALLFVLIVGIGVLVWQTLSLKRTVANQTTSIESAINKAAIKQI